MLAALRRGYNDDANMRVLDHHLRFANWHQMQSTTEADGNAFRLI